MSGKPRVPSLRDRSLEGIEHAGILVRLCQPLQTRIEFVRVVFGELGNRTNAESVEVALDGRADGNKVTKLAMRSYKGPLRISLSVRHSAKTTVPQPHGSAKEKW
jgi:hypothetical protein